MGGLRQSRKPFKFKVDDMDDDFFGQNNFGEDGFNNSNLNGALSA